MYKYEKKFFPGHKDTHVHVYHIQYRPHNSLIKIYIHVVEKQHALKALHFFTKERHSEFNTDRLIITVPTY